MSKRTFNEYTDDADNDRTIDFAPAHKRTKLLVMPASANKVGKYDEKAGITRTSNLHRPTMILEGHDDALYACRFSDDGVHIASGGRDRDILLWNVYGECENHTTLKGHKGAIMQLEWDGSNELLFSSSTDNTGAIWNVEYGARLKKVKEHSGLVNSIYPTKKGVQYFATGSDDGTAKIFDIRMRPCLQRFDSTYQVTSVAITNNCTKLFTGGIDNCIKVWDARKHKEPLYVLMKHTDTITSLKLSSDQNYLLSNGMDNRLCIWDIRPFVSDSDAAAAGGRHGLISKQTQNALLNNSRNVNINKNEGNNNNNDDEEEKEDIDVQTVNVNKQKKNNGKSEIDDNDDDNDDNDDNNNENKNENDSRSCKDNASRMESDKKKRKDSGNIAQIYDSKTESMNRLYRVFGGAQHGNEKLLIKANWSQDGRRVCCGSSDKMAYIFDVETGKLLYRLPGHKGCVNEVDYHPREPIVLSCSSDKTMFLGEL